MSEDSDAEHVRGDGCCVSYLGYPVGFCDGGIGDSALLGRGGGSGSSVFLRPHMGGSCDADVVHVQRLVHRDAGHAKPYGG